MTALVLLLVLIAVPIAEIAVLIEVGGLIGTPATIGLIIATAVAGTALIRLQGLGVITQIRRGLEHDRPTLLPLVDGLFLLVSGVLLLTPGFVTDAVGFALLVPPLRRLIARSAWRWLSRRGDGAGDIHAVQRPGDRPAPADIEGRFVDLGTRPSGRRRPGAPPSPWSDGPDT